MSLVPDRLLVAWLVVIAIDVLAAVGLTRLEFQHGDVAVFRDASERFADYESHVAEFGTFDGLLVRVAGGDLATPAARTALADFLIELQFLETVGPVISPFSVPVPDGKGGVATLETLEGPPGETWPRARAGQPALERLLSANRQAALITVFGVDEATEIAGIAALAKRHLAASGLVAQVSGLPVILERSRMLLMRDFAVLNVAGAVTGTLVAIVALNSIWLALVTLLSSGTAVLWAVGLMGWMGIEINVISISLPVLVLALSLSDAIHVGLEQRALAVDGQPNPVARSLWRIGPAAVLTSLTTAIAFASLGISESAVIARVGLGGALAVIAAVCGVLAANGVVSATLLRRVDAKRLLPRRSRAIRHVFDWRFLPRTGLAAPRLVSAVAIAATVAALAGYLHAPTRFSLYENLRGSDPALAALYLIEADFGATASLQIPLTLGSASPADAARAAIRAIGDAAPRPPVSVAELATVAETTGMGLTDLIAPLPAPMRAALIGSPSGRIAVSIPFSYENATTTRALVDRIEARLAAGLSPDDGVTAGRVTGLYAMSAFASETMIRALGLSLLAAVAASGLLIAIWLRSIRAGMIALIANVLPVAAVGAVCGLSGLGLTFATGIALTLAFGIAVDDTIHVFNRLRLSAAEGSGKDPLTAAMARVTPVLVVTSLVLVAGLAGTLAASLPTVSFFGMLTMAVFILALIADLLVLPALIRCFAS